MRKDFIHFQIIEVCHKVRRGQFALKITVYCGAYKGDSPIYEEKAKELGSWMADQGHTLVCGGGSVGLMGAVANAVIEGGGEAIGVIPEFLQDRELGHTGISQLEIVSTMTDRKMRMINLGDAFIALPGGLGTLEEIFEVTSWIKLGQVTKPALFYNIAGYYDSLEPLFDHMVAEGFLDQEPREDLVFVKGLERIKEIVRAYSEKTEMFSE